MDQKQENMWVQTGTQLAAARALLAASKLVIERWHSGRLDVAVRLLNDAIEDAEEAGLSTGERE